ncbi:MAG: helix-turn-helix domain-containing protein [Treponema sp.]|nr:helix-turn-helix domain-containing protein [Treponema sp.]
MTASRKKCCTHFTRNEREEIAIGLERGESIRTIATRPGRNPSSVSRNAPRLRNVRYRGNRAHQRAKVRSRQSRQRRLANPVIRAYGGSH